MYIFFYYLSLEFKRYVTTREDNLMTINTSHDPYWDAVVYLFSRHSKLKNYIKYIDQNTHTIKVAEIKKLSNQWSTSEKFFLDLALHLYNSDHHVDLNVVDRLDANNRKLFFNALDRRFSR